jgi:hypothetical protein
VDATATAHRENLADVVAAMTEMQAGDTSSGPDLSEPAGTTDVPEDFPLDAAADPDSSVEVFGPDPLEAGAFSTTVCGEDIAAIPREITLGHLGYREVYEAEGSHGRRITAYPTVQDAVDEVERLRSQLAGCDQDTAPESTQERAWHVFGARMGYDDVTFGNTSVGALSGTLFTVVRVGNAVLALTSSGEFSEASLREAIPGHRAIVEAVAPEMCIFTADGC